MTALLFLPFLHPEHARLHRRIGRMWCDAPRHVYRAPVKIVHDVRLLGVDSISTIGTYAVSAAGVVEIPRREYLGGGGSATVPSAETRKSGMPVRSSAAIETPRRLR